ncbi:hypothetical protein PS2_014175 [Malus domestica]
MEVLVLLRMLRQRSGDRIIEIARLWGGRDSDFDGDLVIIVGVEAFEDLSGLVGDDAALVDASKWRNDGGRGTCGGGVFDRRSSETTSCSCSSSELGSPPRSHSISLSPPVILSPNRRSEEPKLPEPSVTRYTTPFGDVNVRSPSLTPLSSPERAADDYPSASDRNGGRFRRGTKGFGSRGSLVRSSHQTIHTGLIWVIVHSVLIFPTNTPDTKQVRPYDEISELFLVTEELRQLAGKRVRRDVDFCQIRISAEIFREGTGEAVVEDLELPQFRIGGQDRRKLAGKEIVIEIQRLQLQSCNCFWDFSGEGVQRQI